MGDVTQYAELIVLKYEPHRYLITSGGELIEAELRIYASVSWSSLFQIMACRLVGAKPLCESILEYC